MEFDQAMQLAQQWDQEKLCGTPALVVRALYQRIMSHLPHAVRKQQGAMAAKIEAPLSSTIDTPMFRQNLGEYNLAQITTEEFISYIDAHTAAVAAKALAAEHERCKARIMHLTHERDLALAANRALNKTEG